WVYVLKSKSGSKSYVGQTDNLQRRLDEHNAGKSAFSKRFIPWQLVHTESFVTREEAVFRETFLKSKTGRIFLKQVVFD
ncbi:MAG: GIY-YIG nuclease family protein, partial [bacterium]|nr:GIY-YIG nuclease family protein [bacterium]